MNAGGPRFELVAVGLRDLESVELLANLMGKPWEVGGSSLCDAASCSCPGSLEKDLQHAGRIEAAS